MSIFFHPHGHLLFGFAVYNKHVIAANGIKKVSGLRVVLVQVSEWMKQDFLVFFVFCGLASQTSTGAPASFNHLPLKGW